MSDIEKAYQATPAATLEQQIMDPNFPKNEREWWAAARIEQLEAALLTGVCMLSEMGLDPREKCQMAYDYMSAALEKRT